MQHIRKLASEVEKELDYVSDKIDSLKEELKDYVDCGSTIEQLSKLKDDLCDQFSCSENEIFQNKLKLVIASVNTSLIEANEKYVKLASDKIVTVNRYNELKKEYNSLLEEFRQYKEFLDYYNLKEYEEFQNEITQPTKDDNVFVLGETKYNMNLLHQDFNVEELWNPEDRPQDNF